MTMAYDPSFSLLVVLLLTLESQCSCFIFGYFRIFFECCVRSVAVCYVGAYASWQGRCAVFTLSCFCVFIFCLFILYVYIFVVCVVFCSVLTFSYFVGTSWSCYISHVVLDLSCHVRTYNRTCFVLGLSCVLLLYVVPDFPRCHICHILLRQPCYVTNIFGQFSGVRFFG